MSIPSAGITQFRCLAVGPAALSAPNGAPAFLCSGLYAWPWRLPPQVTAARSALSTNRTFAGHSRPPGVHGGRGRELGNDHDHAPMSCRAGRGDHRLIAAPEG